ncbi:MAG TPA: hypothetical protein PKV96_02660 [Candidatus Saccharimonas sp.]|nr:hypothetical protein [Candidatus Saccharimonas sp.]
MKEISLRSISSSAVSEDRELFCDIEPDTEFLQRIIADPGFRLRLTQLLKTFNISHYSVDSLGYESRAFVETTHLIELLELGHLEKNERRTVAMTVLEASIEVRDDLNTLFGTNTKQAGPSSKIDYATSLPFPLQLTIIAKVCSGQDGSVLSPASLSKGSERRTGLQQYITTKFGYSDEKAIAILDTICIIHGTSILTVHFEYGVASERWRSLGEFPSSIIGSPATRIGYYLPDGIEDAIRNMHVSDLWRVEFLDAEWHTDGEDAENDKKFIDGMEWLACQVAKLASKPDEELAFWRGYVVTSALAGEALRDGQVNGYSGGHDQLVSWREPKPDKEYWSAYARLQDHVTKYGNAAGTLEREGVLLALQGIAIRLGHDIEQEIIYGTKMERTGRMRVLADIYTQLAINGTEPTELAHHCPLLYPHIQEKAHQWNYRFS